MKNQGEKKISEAVRTSVFNAFSTKFQLEAVDALSRYGLEQHERERDRVQLALVNLCDGNLDNLNDLVAEAKKDYRNILYWSEQA